MKERKCVEELKSQLYLNLFIYDDDLTTSVVQMLLSQLVCRKNIEKSVITSTRKLRLTFIATGKPFGLFFMLQ